MMDNLTTKAVKKLFALVKTKIRLAREADTIYVKPRPVPLVKYFTGAELNTVDECESFYLRLRKDFEQVDDEEAAKIALMLFDLIESVKHEYETTLAVSEEDFKVLEAESKNACKPLTISLMGECVVPCLFIGENPPGECVFLGPVSSNITLFLSYAFKSQHFSQDGRLKNLRVQAGRKTLLNNLVSFSIERLSLIYS